MNHNPPGLWRFFLTAGAVVALDQAAKWAVSTELHYHQIIPVIKGLFNITFITNTGAAFGILAGAEKWRHLFFQTVSFLALGGIFYIYRTSRTSSLSLLCGLPLIFGGALGNLIDRMNHGFVIDFLDFYIRGHHWPAFNVADSAITIGTVLILVHFLRR